MTWGSKAVFYHLYQNILPLFTINWPLFFKMNKKRAMSPMCNTFLGSLDVAHWEHSVYLGRKMPFLVEFWTKITNSMENTPFWYLITGLFRILTVNGLVFGLLMMSNGKIDPFGNKGRFFSTVSSQIESEKKVFSSQKKSVSWQFKMQQIEKWGDLELELILYYYKTHFKKSSSFQGQ